jgi:lysozyme family protein
MSNTTENAFDIWVEYMSPKEGGYVNDPVDRGGATNRGVTIATWNTYAKQFGWPTGVEALKKMTPEQFRFIANSYWIKSGADRILFAPTAIIFAEMFWGSGSAGPRYLQGLLNKYTHAGLVQDGVVGPKTLAVINSYPNPIELFRKLNKDREQYYQNIVVVRPEQQRFLNGWLNRVRELPLYLSKKKQMPAISGLPQNPPKPSQD